MSLFWSFAILLVLILVFVIVIRQRFMSWGWNFALIAIFLYAGLFKMTGTARNAWLFSSIERVHGEVEIVYAQVVQKNSIYLLVQAKPGDVPFYLTINWTKEAEEQLDKAKMEAERRGGSLLANADMLSGWKVNINQPKQQDDGSEQGNMLGGSDKKGGGADIAKGETPKDGGDKMFYPRPVPPDPLKDYKTLLQDPDSTIDEIPLK